VANRLPMAARHAAARIRWDRVGRTALLVVLVGVLLLYVGPLRSWFDTWQGSKARGAEVHALERENARLRARRDELRDPVALEREAGRLGMVRPGERAYVVEGLGR
jgi:cell division protein FtsB